MTWIYSEMDGMCTELHRWKFGDDGSERLLDTGLEGWRRAAVEFVGSGLGCHATLQYPIGSGSISGLILFTLRS